MAAGGGLWVAAGALFQILAAAKLPEGMPSGKDLTNLQRDASDQIWVLRGAMQKTLGLIKDTGAIGG